MNDIKDFPYPLNTDIEEMVPVKKIQVDSIDEKRGSAKFSVRTVLEKQTVRYLHVPKEKYRCPEGTHVYRVLNPRKFLFACTKCPFVRRVFPTTYRFDSATGSLIHKKTGRRV